MLSLGYALIYCISFFVVPTCIFLAYRGWKKRYRFELPRWRIYLGLSSILATLFSWLAYLFLLSIAALEKFNIAYIDTNVGSSQVNAIAIVSGAGALVALSLKGAPRLQTAAAGALMSAIWLLTVIEISF